MPSAVKKRLDTKNYFVADDEIRPTEEIHNLSYISVNRNAM